MTIAERLKTFYYSKKTFGPLVQILFFTLILLVLNLQNSTCTIHLATPVAIYFLLSLGLRYGVIVFICAVIPRWISPDSTLHVLEISIAVAVEAMAGAWAISAIESKKSQMTSYFKSLYNFGLAFLLPFISMFTIYVVDWLLDHPTETPGFWQTWYLSHVLGNLLISNLLLNLRTLFRKHTSAKKWSIEIVSLGRLALLLAGCLVVFMLAKKPFYLLLALPLLFFVEHYASRLELSLFAVLFAFLVIVLNHYRFGAFAAGPKEQEIYLMQLFILNVSLVTLILSGLQDGFSKEFFYRILAASWILILITSFLIDINQQKRNFERLVSTADRTALEITKYLKNSESLLVAGATLAGSTPGVMKYSDWLKFANMAHADRRSWDILGIGLIYPVPQGKMATYKAQIKKQLPGFRTHDVPLDTKPSKDAQGEKAQYIITYIVPLELNRSALGLNVASEANRKKAADLARDTGAAAITAPITLVQRETSKLKASLLFVPFYNDDPKTIQARRAEIRGWAYAPIDTAKVFEGFLRSVQNDLYYIVLDGSEEQRDSILLMDGLDPKSEFEYSTPLSFGQRQFTIGWRGKKSFYENNPLLDQLQNYGPLFALLLSLSFTLLKKSQQNALALANQKSKELSLAYDKLSVVAKEAMDYQERFSYALTSGNMGFWDWNIKTNTLTWDERMFDLYGIPKDKFTNNYEAWKRGLHPDDAPIAEQAIQDAINGIKPFDLDFRIITDNHEVRYIHAFGFVERDPNGEALHISGFNWNVTEAKIREQKLEKALKDAELAGEAKTMFLANMSHEIRTPINGIIGMTNLLMQEKLAGDQKQYAENIKLCSDSLLEIINDVLDFSKIEAGKIELEKSNFELRHLIDEVTEPMRMAAEQKGLTFELDYMAQNCHYVIGDPGRIRQILMNLLSNAIKFTAKGKVTLKVRSLEDLGNALNLKFEVQDTGVGIPAKKIKDLFQSFSQADASVTRKFGGTGLGLSISKMLVELMNGSIGVESKEGVGSIFWFQITLPKGTKIVQKPQIEVDVSAIQGKKILVVEDNIMNQKVALRHLEKIGVSPIAVANGIEALDLMNHVHFDLVLMDCQMPELDGYETTKIIRSRKDQPYSQIPIVGLTANAIVGEREKCLAAGMDDYLTKPFDVKDLKQKLVDNI